MVAKGGDLTGGHNDIPLRDYTDNSVLILALLRYLQQYPDTLFSANKTAQMIRQLDLSPAFQAVTMLAMKPMERQQLLAQWLSSSERMSSLFLDKSFSMKQQYTGPWFPLMAIMQHDLPDPTNDIAAVALENHVEQYMKQIQEQALPDLSPELMTQWKNAEQVELYGRSLRISGRERTAESQSSHGIRLKFRKQEVIAESWDDLAREQAVLSCPVLSTPPTMLESQQLKAGGIYRLPDARRVLSNSCYLPKEFQQPLQQSVYFESDGSAQVQLLEDSQKTEHYHHYPYLIDPDIGLTRESALEGIRLYCRDSGKFWRNGIKSPDAMGVFHNQAGSKPWNPLAGYTLKRQGLFCTSSLCDWNAQIPDIAHAPVGLRDFQGLIAMNKLPSGLYGERRLDWSDPLDMRRGRLVELGKQFYGVTLNWLRVRHDLDELNHTNPEHLDSLCDEMVTLYADLFSHAFGGEATAWRHTLSTVLPAETLNQAARECLCWCSPQHPYVADIRSQRFPSEVYPDHTHKDLKLANDSLYDDGYKSHPDAVGTNLGHNGRGGMVLHHLASIFWFGVMEGVVNHSEN